MRHQVQSMPRGFGAVPSEKRCRCRCERVRSRREQGLSLGSKPNGPTGKSYKAAEGVAVGMAQYLVPAGGALEKAIALAERMAENAPMTNYALMHGLARIAEQPADHGHFTEAMLAGITQSAPEAKAPATTALGETLRRWMAGKRLTE